MRRRDLFVSGALGTVLGGFGAPADADADADADAGAAQSPSSERAIDRLGDVVESLRRDLRDQRAFAEIAAVRDAQKQFLRANGKLPDFIEAGMDVWFQVHDWHIRWQVALQQARDAQGRMTLALNGTLVVLRTDVVASYVGIPYDAR